MESQIQRKLGSGFVAAVLLPTLTTGLLATAAAAQPQKIAGLPSNAVARTDNSQTLSLETAKQLLNPSNAQDLEYRPPMWNWTTPVTVQRVGQATTPPASSTAQAAPDAADDASDILDEVSVTATRRLTRQRDITATTYSIKKEDFQKQGAATVTDALQLVPGFQAQPSLGGVRNAGGVFLRGFDDQRFQVLRDGLSLTRSSNNRNDVSRFAIDDLERIEVVTGGATLRYGSGAVGGVINLITETPKGPPKLTLWYQGGSYGFSRYTAKYGGGDDTFSYNFVYTGLVAQNNYPFRYTLPSSAQFYGPTTNPNSLEPLGSGGNSFGLPNSDPANNGAIDLFGYLKPEVGPPITISGIADQAFNASDTYSAKLVFKPDPTNRIALRLNQQNSRNAGNGPGGYSFTACGGGNTTAPNGTFNIDRFLPINPDGTENQAACSPGVFVPNTRPFQIFSGLLTGTAFSPFVQSADGRRTFAAGQAYTAGVETVTGTIDQFQYTEQSQTEAAIQWDYDITPTTSLNSYIYYYKFGGTSFRQNNLFTSNTDLSYAFSFLANPARVIGNNGYVLNPAAQPYFEGNKLELQSALNYQFSPASNLQFGLNYTEDRSYQQKSGGRTFFDAAISRSSAFLIFDLSFSDQLKANIGGRYTYSTQFGAVGTPAVGIRYNLSNLLSFRANGSYVFNAPSISDLNVSGAPFIANPNLRPESGVTYDFGVDITPARNIGLQFTYFNTYLDGAIGTVAFVQAGGLAFQQRNRDSRYASGIEARGTWQVTDQVSFQVVWTNTDARNYGPVDSPNQSTFPNFYQYQDPNIPNNNVVASLTYANKGLTATLLTRYDSGKRRFGSTYVVPAWATLDFNVEVPVTPYFTITGSVFNLTDTQYEVLDGLPGVGTTFRVGGRLEIGG